MTLKTTLVFILTTLILGGLSYKTLDSNIVNHDFIDLPTQTLLEEEKSIQVEGDEGLIQIDLLAKYSIKATVKSVENYSDDLTAQISPRDFALAWGDINNSFIDKYVTYSQKERWYYFTVSSKAPVNIDYVDLHSANTHIIPANDIVDSIVKEVSVDDSISMEGYLVNVTFENGYWNSSLVREDTGDGSCEIMYVTNITINR